MTQYDRRGLSVTTTSAAAVRHLDEAVRSFLAHRSDAALHLEHALSADAGLVVARSFFGLAQLLLGRSELFPAARGAAKLASAAIRERGATLRERRIFDALSFWLADDMESCAATLEAAVQDEPLDALSLKLAHAVRFMLGDAQSMRRAAETAAGAWTSSVPDCGFIRGCHAFALEETGEMAEAMRLAFNAMELEPDDVWGRHALVHVCHARRAVKAGLNLLQELEGHLGPVNNFAYHLGWHEALFEVARGGRKAAFDLYDRKVRCAHTDDYRDIANGASLLWYFEQRGWDVGNRWRALADLAENRLDDGALVFAQLHYLLCLVGAGRGKAAVDLLAAMQQRAEHGIGTQARILRSVGLPLSAMIARGFDHGATDNARDLPPIANALHRIGGSHLQRVLFHHLIAAARGANSSALPPAIAASFGAAA